MIPNGSHAQMGAQTRRRIGRSWHRPAASLHGDRGDARSASALRAHGHSESIV